MQSVPITTKSCEFEPRSWQGVLDTTLCDKVCQWLATGQWFSPGTLVSSTNKTDCHDITEILLKVALNTINLNWVHCYYTKEHVFCVSPRKENLDLLVWIKF
jgi:hypothetical protein